MQAKEKCLWTLIAFFAILIGLYPIGYSFDVFRQNSLLRSKAWELLTSSVYMTAFYTHISSGGVSLLTGWSQFIRSWRNKHPTFHRYLGYIYVLAVFTSSITGFIMAFFSTGGVVGAFGFGSLAVVWLTTILFAFTKISAVRQLAYHQVSV